MKTPEVWITVGKRGFNDEDLEKLLNYQIAAFRINTGRSSFDWTYHTISKMISMGIAPEKILLDIGNKKTRISLKCKDKIDLHINDILSISKDDTLNTDGWLYSSLFYEKITMGDIVYFGDGEIECSIVEISDHYIKLKSLSNGTLTDNVSIGIVGKELNHFYIDSDEISKVNKILSDFPVSLILSFVENRDNILWAMKVFPKAHRLIPKIETNAAVNNFASIVDISKMVFIGRGDLGLSVGIEKIGILQKRLILQAHKANCYVAIGTGTLDSLKWSQVPLRSEIIDITNYCSESVDGIVLTSETAGSKQPFKAIDFLMKTLLYISKNG